MFNQYSYKAKFKFLLVFIVILSIAAYKRSFANLFVLYSEYGNLKEKNMAIATQKPNIKNITEQISTLDQLIGKDGVEKDKIQQGIVDFLVQNGVSVSIFDMQPVHEFETDDYMIYTFQLDVTGNYNQLQELAYRFEKDYSLSKIVSLKFYKEKKNNKTDVLHLKLIFQNYENKK